MWCSQDSRAPPGQGLLRRESLPHTGGMAPNPSAGRRMPRWSVRSRILATMLAVTALAMVAVGGVTFLRAARARGERGRRSAHRSCRRCEQRRHGCFWSPGSQRRLHRHELEPLHDDLVRARGHHECCAAGRQRILDRGTRRRAGVRSRRRGPVPARGRPRAPGADRRRGERWDRPARRGGDAGPPSAVHRDSRGGRRRRLRACSSPRSMWTPSSPS